MISLSIIVPTLDSYQQLPSLVKSLKSQTITCWKVLFIDGKSNKLHRDWLNNQSVEDSRFQTISQDESYTGIYGAMNQGLHILDGSDDWVLFWGSDDMAASPEVFEKLVNIISSDMASGKIADLYVCRGRYFTLHRGTVDHINTYKKKRESSFGWRGSFRRSLFLGSTPPHQATIFGPRVRSILSHYNTDFILASDLDGFLRISKFSGIIVKLVDLELVLMGDRGVSALQGKRRYQEVVIAYKKAFGALWMIPFILRYFQRLISLVS
jgi:glycosyltransferase involved in cell wall biosynthesis